MTITPATHPGFLANAYSADSDEVVSPRERMTAAHAAMASEEDDDAQWPLLPRPDPVYLKAKREMMVQPFIELMFYGEEEETGNVTLSLML